MKKAELEKRIDELSNTIWDYRRELNSWKERCGKAEEELAAQKRYEIRYTNQIHFLAWMLAWNGVSLDEWYHWLDVRIEVPPKEWDRKML